MCLQNACEETLREIKSTHPVTEWRLSIKPISHKFHSVYHVLKPWGQWLEWSKRNFSPQTWQYVILERQVHLVQFLRHNCETFDGFFELGQCLFKRRQKIIEFFHFLNQDNGQRMHVAFFIGDKMILIASDFIKQFWKYGFELISHLHYNLIRAFASSSTQADSGLNRQNGFHDFVRLLRLISDVGIFVHSKHLRIFKVR